MTRREKTGSLTVWAVSHSEHVIFLGYLYIKNATVIYLDNFKPDWLIGGGLRTFQKLSGHNSTRHIHLTVIGVARLYMAAPAIQLDGEETKYAWNNRSIDGLEGTELEWSTTNEGDGKEKNSKRKLCYLCLFTYSGGPLAIRTHLDPTIKPRQVRPFNPKNLDDDEYGRVERHAEVLKALRLRVKAALERKKKEVSQTSVLQFKFRTLPHLFGTIPPFFLL